MISYQVAKTEYLTQPATYAVLDSKIEWLDKQLARLNRKAFKLGCEPLSYKVLEQYVLRNTCETGGKATEVVLYTIIKLNGETPKLNGWTFVATIEHLEGGNILRASPLGRKDEGCLPFEYRTREPICEHCNTNRKRIDTYLLLHDNGEYKQVGKSCLKDFLGHNNPVFLAQYELELELADLLDGDNEEGDNKAKAWALEEYLGVVREVINHAGWISKSAAYDVSKSTAHVAFEAFLTDKLEGKIIPSEASMMKAYEVIEWACGIDENEPNDYLQNLRVLANSGIVRGRTLGLAASMFVAYDHSLRRQRKVEEESKSEYQGKVKERSNFIVTVDKIIVLESYQYGDSYLHIMNDPMGNVFTWKSSSTKLEEGKTYVLKGTVKEHKLYKEKVKQTVLTRCSVVMGQE